MADEEKPLEEVANDGPDVLGTPHPEEAVASEEVGMEVGDTILVIGGRLNGTQGKLYTFSDDRFTLLPVGVTDRVISIPLVDGAPDPDFEIQEMPILSKAVKPGFVNMIDIHTGQYVETFRKGGEPNGVFEVVSVDEERDAVVLKDEAGVEEEIVFGFQGIPRDLPYEVIRTREPPAMEEPSQSEGIYPVSRVAVEEEDALEQGQLPSASEDAEAEAIGATTKAALDFALGELIELPADEEIEEIGTAQRTYPDVFQRSEMLAQLIRRLPASQQRDPIKLQEIRRTVEMMMILRNDVVNYGVTGDPVGMKTTSLNTLAELIQRPDSTLTRKVANIDKVIYADHTEQHILDMAEGRGGYDPSPGIVEEGIRVDYLGDVVKRASTLVDTAELGAGDGAAGGLGMPKFFLDLEKYRQQIQQPYVFNGAGIPVERDEEVFRREIPNVDEPELNALSEVGVPSKVKGSYIIPNVFNPPTLTQVPYGLTRALKQRWSHFLTGEALRVVEPAETLSYTNVLVFPLSTLRDIGPIRSGILAQDMSLGAMLPRSMDDLLKDLGDISDFPTADSILSIGVQGNILGNVTLKDWFTSLNLKIDGLGDVYSKLRGYGIQNIELSKEQVTVLEGVIEEKLAALRLFMTKQREENQAVLANLKFEPNPLLKPEDGARLLSRLESEPVLQSVLEEVRGCMGELATVDMNWFTYIFLQYPDLLLSVLGQQANMVARERLRHVRDLFIQATMAGYRMKQKLLTSAEPPVVNRCKHVKRLEQVRKIQSKNADEPRDVTKVKLLVKLLDDFRGKTEDNWVWCKICKNHLICAHELVQIQEYIRPAEQENLHKEMLINFSGGVFSGKYICRVCGQAMQELEFDQNLEFDDEGRPMMGRSVMVDREAIELDEINEMLKGPAETVEEISFGNDELNTMYRTLKKIASLMGISPEDSDYRTMVEDFSLYNSTLPTREEYAEATKGKKAQDYDIYYSIRYVTAAAAILLLNIQTRVPDYVIYYTTADCKDGFFGYPLEEESNTSGIQCVATIVAGINDNEFPWNMTTLQRKSNLIVRRDAILPFIKGQLDTFSRTPIQQAALERKREYRTKLFGKVGGLKADQISKTFRPVPMILTEEEAAADHIIPEAATPEKQATAWIRMAHSVARKSAALNPDAPVVETTCCLHKVQNPSEFWKELPKLEPKVTKLGGYRSTTASTTFYTEKPKALQGKIDSKDYYLVFAKLCYRGENKGLSHKLGLTLTCSECGLNFKTDPRIPLTANPDSKKAAEESAKAAADLEYHLVSQGVVINDETFEDLINTAHLKATVTTKPLPNMPHSNETFTFFASADPQPFSEWPVVLNKIQVTLAELGSSVTRTQIATASEDLVRIVSEKEEFIRSRIGPEVFRYIQTLTKKTPRECGEALSAYILVPFQRRLTGVVPEKFKILDSYELSTETKQDILVKGLGQHLKPVGDDQELTGLALRKVRQLVDDVSGLCKNIFPTLRTILLPGGSIMLEYFMRAYIMGIIQKYMDPHQIPQGDEELGGGATAAANFKMLYKALAQAISKYAVASKVPSEEEIRMTIEKRAEKERQIFVKERDTMTRDRRKVEGVLKELGMGKWAVGGSKAIRQYDADRYEAERQERIAAGIVDYPGVEAVNQADVEGHVTYDAQYAYEGDGERMDGDYTDGAMREDEY